ncbi:MAG: LmeA family phospholipid-binding protein [Armatimonadetes bacterium]|nr:LmeA family phospholipid-binding protein [Armatimonadota bacterium]
MESVVSCGHVDLRLDRLKLPNGLLVDSLSLDADNLQFDTQSKQASLATAGTCVATVSEQSLTEFLMAELPSAIRKVEVQCVGGRIQIAAIARVIVEIKALALCRLEIVDERELYVRLESVTPGGPVEGIVESNLEKVNPVFKSEDIPFPVRMLEARVEHGKVQLICQVMPPE